MKLSKSFERSTRSGRGLAARTALGLTLMAAPAVPITVLSVPAASAAVTCNAGTWGYVWGWGDCTGSGQWRLKVSCTWGGSGLSGIQTGPAHVDVRCNIGSARSASIVYL